MIYPALHNPPRPAWPRLSQAHVHQKASSASDAAKPIPPQGLVPPYEPPTPATPDSSPEHDRAWRGIPSPGAISPPRHAPRLRLSPLRSLSDPPVRQRPKMPSPAPFSWTIALPTSHVRPSDGPRCSPLSGRHSYVQSPCACPVALGRTHTWEPVQGRSESSLRHPAWLAQFLRAHTTPRLPGVRRKGSSDPDVHHRPTPRHGLGAGCFSGVSILGLHQLMCLLASVRLIHSTGS